MFKIARGLIVALMLMPVVAGAAGGGGFMMSAGNDVSDTASLQRGARNFVNYCMGCHSAKYIRFNKLQADLGLTEEQVKENLMFAATKTDDKGFGLPHVGTCFIPKPRILFPIAQLHHTVLLNSCIVSNTCHSLIAGSHNCCYCSSVTTAATSSAGSSPKCPAASTTSPTFWQLLASAPANCSRTNSASHWKQSCKFWIF